LQEGTGSRPINKLIRFDIKGTKRKWTYMDVIMHDWRNYYV
jgi:hypothetical protein